MATERAVIQIAVLLKRLKTFGAINICLPVAVQQRLVQVTKLSFVIGSRGIQSLINAPRMALAVTKTDAFCRQATYPTLKKVTSRASSP